MKKYIRMACAAAVLAGALTVSALAADFTASADHLSELGLFRGTEQGYELDRAPSRAEAAVMLVRLLGAEEEAQQLEYSAPFTDLQGWEQPYVQYLYENGLTTGATATAFEPEGACSAQMYAAFLLRALGYTEAAGDFTYAQAATAAQGYGVYDPAVIDTQDFLRDDVAAASYTALSVAPKGAVGTLLDRLVQAGAVDAEAAQPCQALFETYAQYRAEVAGMAELDSFSVRGGMAAKADGADGYQLTVRTEDYTTVGRADSTAVSEGTLTMESPTAGSYTQVYRRDAAEQAEAERTAMLYGYGVVPVALVEEIGQSGSSWTFTLAGLPLMYQGQIWALARSGGAVWEIPAQSTLTQTVRSGRITSQELTTAVTAADLHADVTVTGELDTAQ